MINEDLKDFDDENEDVEEREQETGFDDDENGSEIGQEKGEDDENEEGQVSPEPRSQNRASRAIVEAKRSAREAADRAARLEREVAELRQQRQQPLQETREQEEARLALMSFEERIEYKLEKATRDHERQLALVQFQSADAADKAAYEAKASYNSVYKKYSAEVEKLLLSERQAGRTYPRETILKFVLGERVMNAKPQIDKQRREAQQRVNKQRTVPDGGRSDRSSSRERNGDTLLDLERRLDGKFI